MEDFLMNLPTEHPLRNAPLVSIGAETKFMQGKQWKPVEPYWKIAKFCYNDLGPAWTEAWVWRATKSVPASA